MSRARRCRSRPGSLQRRNAPIGATGIEPMAHPLAGLAQRLRADEVTETDRHALYQQNAPRVESGLYIVPKVIE